MQLRGHSNIDWWIQLFKIFISGNMPNYGAHDPRYPRPLWLRAIRTLTTFLWSSYFAVYVGACIKGLAELVHTDKSGWVALSDSSKVLRVLLLRNIAASLKMPPISGTIWLVAFGIVTTCLYAAARVAKADAHTEGFVLDTREAIMVGSAHPKMEKNV